MDAISCFWSWISNIIRKTLPLELAFVYLIYLVNSFSCKVFVRCKCQTLKKEWFCQDVQAAHRNAGSDPRDIPKNQYGIGLLPCNFTVLVLQFFILKSAHLNFFFFVFFVCLSFFGTGPEQHHILKLRVRYSNSIHSLWLNAYRMCMEATLVDNDLHYRCAIVIHGMQSCRFVGG